MYDTTEWTDDSDTEGTSSRATLPLVPSSLAGLVEANEDITVERIPIAQPYTWDGECFGLDECSFLVRLFEIDRIQTRRGRMGCMLHIPNTHKILWHATMTCRLPSYILLQGRCAR